MSPFASGDFQVDRSGGIPVGTQLAWRLRRLIASGRLAPGERLPGVRDLAGAAGVNVNTARAVYARLEDQGYLRSRQGKGTFVRERPPTDQRFERVERLAAELEAGAHAEGLDPHEVVAHLYGRSEPAPDAVSVPAAPESRVRAPTDVDEATRRELRDQIAELEARLAWLPQFESAPLEAPSPGRPSSALLTSEQLTDVRNALRARLERAEAARAEILRELRYLEAMEPRDASPRSSSSRRDSPSVVGARVRFSGGT